tara:strand:+ start:1253 stop:2113 length:861 start_codon:yes stop_codon:yes gene_type:complete
MSRNEPEAISNSSPVIMLGRGGGGTRLLSEFIAGQGVFLGSKLNKSYDSVEWVETVYDIAIEVLSADAPPTPTQRAGYVERLHNTAADVLARSGRDTPACWGWKLPETTLICGLVKEAFPKAQFLHLVRHPVNASLRRTHMTSRMNNPMGAAALPAAYRHVSRDPALIETDDTIIHNACSWCHQADLMLNTFSDEPALHTIRFEHMCAAPDTTATALRTFLNHPAPPGAPGLQVDQPRAAGPGPDADQARRVWDICGQTAAAFGFTLQEALNGTGTNGGGHHHLTT